MKKERQLVRITYKSPPWCFPSNAYDEVQYGAPSPRPMLCAVLAGCAALRIRGYSLDSLDSLSAFALDFFSAYSEHCNTRFCRNQLNPLVSCQDAVDRLYLLVRELSLFGAWLRLFPFIFDHAFSKNTVIIVPLLASFLIKYRLFFGLSRGHCPLRKLSAILLYSSA